MLTRTFAVVALALGALTAVPAAAQAATPAVVSASAPTVHAAAACTYRRSGNVWKCVTPGAYCPKAARGKYGYGKTAPAKRYKCSQYPNGQWRWKRA
jgi:hypothetical protein